MILSIEDAAIICALSNFGLLSKLKIAASVTKDVALKNNLVVPLTKKGVDWIVNQTVNLVDKDKLQLEISWWKKSLKTKTMQVTVFKQYGIAVYT